MKLLVLYAPKQFELKTSEFCSLLVPRGRAMVCLNMDSHFSSCNYLTDTPNLKRFEHFINYIWKNERTYISMCIVKVHTYSMNARGT